MEARAASPSWHTASLVALGAVAGLAWAAALRAWMGQLAGVVGQVHWLETVVAILLPGLVAGALLGWAEARRRAGLRRGLRWFALAPFAFSVATLALPGALITLVTEGIGGGSIGVPAAAVVGGFALGQVGPRWLRIVAGVVACAALVAFVATAPLSDGARLGLDSPRGVWVALMIGSLMVLAMVAASIPFRPVKSS